VSQQRADEDVERRRPPKPAETKVAHLRVLRARGSVRTAFFSAWINKDCTVDTSWSTDDWRPMSPTWTTSRLEDASMSASADRRGRDGAVLGTATGMGMGQ
jgi:hypothetical protein